ncbi:MAG: hypothetical protein N4A38_03975 [Candidatus Gracilibacteria bacterium]|nr:hypothetical protein [Candidatus Gracilibacteria bacterium]
MTGDICDSNGNCLGGGIIDQTKCQSANWLWIPPASDMNIGTGKGEGFCISPALATGSSGGGLSVNGWGTHRSGLNTSSV